MKRCRKQLTCLVVVLLAGCGGVAGLDGCDLDFGAGPGGPLVVNFWPESGFVGTLVTIEGLGFSSKTTENHVQIGGVDAIVVEASLIKVEALVGFGAATGKIEVEVNGQSKVAATDFTVRDWTSLEVGEDGPPIFYEGQGAGLKLGGAKQKRGAAALDLAPSGTINVLVIPSYATDLVPPNQVAARQAISDQWTSVTTFYDQASYGDLDVQITVANWIALSGVFSDYVTLAGESWAPNITTGAAHDQFRAETISGAAGDPNITLNDFDAVASYIWTNNAGLRAWGGGAGSNFQYSGNGLDINITADHELALMSLGEDSNWGRCAHELGHCIVNSPLTGVLGEDVYSSDLIDASSATARKFEMMGSHDTHPLFSGFMMHQLGWYDDANIVGGDDDNPLQWTRNAFSQDYEIVAHGLVQDNDADRVHLVRIKVTDGLYFFVEVRQRPPAGSAQVFDDQIPLGGAPNDGGVVVTKVLTDEVNNNQEMRYITLMHDVKVLTVNDNAQEPARDLTITVLGEQIDAQGRLVSTVRIEWAQNPDPAGDDGDFDLRIEPWGPGWETVDIWVDRNPWDVYDNVDADGNPTGNGDKPAVGEQNRFYARVHCDGVADANDVKVHFYSITPPGVGDNGNWTSLPNSPVDFGAIVAGSEDQDRTIWVPVVGEHTCLQVEIEHQLGEVTFGNNKAQENVFEFNPPASSVPSPIKIPLAVRNPKGEAAIVLVRLVGVPENYLVQLPHRWVHLAANGEKELNAIVIPLVDIEQTVRYPMDLVIAGDIYKSFQDLVDDAHPASVMQPIGGITAMIRPKHRVEIFLEEGFELKDADTIGIKGELDPPYADQPVLVRLESPDGEVSYQTATTDGLGKFLVGFDVQQTIFYDPTLDLGGSDTVTQDGHAGPRTTTQGQYKAVAKTIGAPDVIDAESNEVTITFP